MYIVFSAFTSRPTSVVLHGHKTVVSHIKRRTQIEGRPIREQDTEENISIYEEESDKRLQKTQDFFAKYVCMYVCMYVCI
jgi:hypothetical protein